MLYQLSSNLGNGNQSFKAENLMNPSLLSLYASILVSICSEWISNEDLCFLDTAVCNKELKKRFLDLLTLCHTSDLVKDTDKQFGWLVLRGLRLRKMRLYNWSPVTEALIQSNRVFCLHIGIHRLVEHWDLIRGHVAEIGVTFSNAVNLSQWQRVGSAVTEVSYDEDDVFNIEDIVSTCPNLKKISGEDISFPIIDADKGQFILPLVDACQLDEINNCHLGSLVKRERCKWSYTCDLRRTYEVNDEAAVCLGEGKYYHVTKLSCRRSMTEEDVDLLIPLISNLSTLCLDLENNLILHSILVEKCHSITDLDLDNVDTIQLKPMLHHLSTLRRLDVSPLSNSLLKFDDCIEVMSRSCLLLEKCVLNNGMVEAESVLSTFFKKCHHLSEFTVDTWPYESVLVFAENIENLCVGESLWTLKFGRGLKKLHISNRMNSDVIGALMAKNPMRSVYINTWLSDFNDVIKSMVRACPMLSKFTARSVNNKLSLTPLGSLHNLEYLTIEYLFTVETLSAMLENKAFSLLSLTLDECGITNDMVAVIGKLCPALTSLDLSGNGSISNNAIVDLLASCTKLEMLSLEGCVRITSEIVPTVKSSSLKQLIADGTNISFSERNMFGSIFQWIRKTNERPVAK